MKKRGRIIKCFLFLLILLFIWILAAPFLAGVLIIEKPLEKADAIFVFGGSSVYVERTRRAAELYKSGAANKIFLTDDGERGGWSQAEQKNPAFVELAKNELIKRGVAAEHIEILQPPVDGTFDEAKVLAETVKAKNLKSVALVTSAYHTRRAFWISEKVLRENNSEILLGIVAPEAGINTPSPKKWWLSPGGWHTVGGEYLKIIVYWLFY